MLKIEISEQNRFLIAVIGGSLLILILGQVILSDLSRRSRKNTQQLAAIEAQLAGKLSIRERREKIIADYAKYKDYLALESMPSRQVIEEFLREIERMARDAGASIINLSPQNIPEAAQKAVEYKVDLRIECSADQLIIFFNSVESSKFLIKVERFSVTPRDEQGVGLKVEMLLSLSVA